MALAAALGTQTQCQLQTTSALWVYHWYLEGHESPEQFRLVHRYLSTAAALVDTFQNADMQCLAHPSMHCKVL